MNDNKTIVNIYVNGDRQNLIKVYVGRYFDEWLKDHIKSLEGNPALEFHDISRNHYVIPVNLWKNSLFAWRDQDER